MKNIQCRVVKDGRYWVIAVVEYKMDKNARLKGEILSRGMRNFKTEKEAWDWLKQII